MEGLVTGGQKSVNYNWADDYDGQGDEQVFYNKQFVHHFFSIGTYSEATEWIVKWIKEKGHNPTEFTQDLPALLEKGLEFREELLKRELENPENAKTFPTGLIMTNCIKDFGLFADISE